MNKSPTRYLDRLESPSGRYAPVTHAAQLIYSHPAFEKIILAVICCNACWIGIDVDWNDEGSPVPPTVFLIGENLFCLAFTFELLVRFCMYNAKMNFFTEAETWKANVFDFFLVSLMVLEVWILTPLEKTGGLSQFSVVRLLRLLRLLRISRIFRMVPELGMMVKNMAKAGRSVSSTLLLEVGIIYMVAVIFTNWTKSHPAPCYPEGEGDGCFLHDLFGSILKSFVTLLQILVFDDTFSIIRPILDDTWYMGVLLILFMVLGSWTVLNMLIGILAEIVVTGTAEEKMKMLEQRVREVFATIDLDGSGSVTREEFNGKAKKQLTNLGISHDVVKNAFEILDEDGSGSFDVDEFLVMIFKLLNPPQSQDLLVLSQKVGQLQRDAFGSDAANSSRSTSKSKLKASKTVGCLTAAMGKKPKANGLHDDAPPTVTELYELRQAAKSSKESTGSKESSNPHAKEELSNPHPFAPAGGPFFFNHSLKPQNIHDIKPLPPDIDKKIASLNTKKAIDHGSSDSFAPLEMPLDRANEIASLEAQTLEIHRKVSEQLEKRAEKVEEALKLPDGYKTPEQGVNEKVDIRSPQSNTSRGMNRKPSCDARDIDSILKDAGLQDLLEETPSAKAKIDGLLKDAGLHDLLEEDKVKAADLVKQYAAQEQRDCLSGSRASTNHSLHVPSSASTAQSSSSDPKISQSSEEPFARKTSIQSETQKNDCQDPDVSAARTPKGSVIHTLE